MSATARSTEESPTIDLTALQHMTYVELDELYRNSRRPSHLADLNGDAIGAMLACRKPATGPLASLLRSFGSSSTLPWKGKSFLSQDDNSGEGINRVTFFGKRRWFPFKTRFGSSFLDGKPTFVLDYSARANPPFIRSIVDEVREVAPGLYFGPAALLVKGRPKPVLFFTVSLQK